MFACLVLAGAPGCTSMTVRPVESRNEMQCACILEDPKVQVSDFLPVLRDGLSRQKIRSYLYSDSPPPDCDVIISYTALRSWGLTPYLSHAEIRVERDGMQVGYEEFYLRGKGGYSLYKWQSTKTKMDPVIDQLFEAHATQ